MFSSGQFIFIVGFFTAVIIMQICCPIRTIIIHGWHVCFPLLSPVRQTAGLKEDTEMNFHTRGWF